MSVRLHRKCVVKWSLFFFWLAFFYSISVNVLVSNCYFSISFEFFFLGWKWNKTKEHNSKQNHELCWQLIWTDKLCCHVRAILYYFYVLQMDRWQKISIVYYTVAQRAGDKLYSDLNSSMVHRARLMLLLRKSLHCRKGSLSGHKFSHHQDLPFCDTCDA